MRMRPYVVRQGDYLMKLAHMMGFDAEVVWNQPANRDLRERRTNPEVLHPGDVICVPAPGERRFRELVAGGSNAYAANVPRAEIRLTLYDPEGAALANVPYRVLGLSRPHEETTDGNGTVRFSAPVYTREVRLVLEEDDEHPILIGDLDPHDELSGVRKRLAHLGYLSRYDPSHEIGDDVSLRRAVRSFQAARQIEVTGEPDEATLHALLDAHGS